MKVSSSLHFARRGASGTALLPALLIVGMVTLVVVLFFNMSTVQLRSSSSHAAVHDLNTLQDMAVNAAIGQMRQGTTESSALWISQPGAIRTYGNSTGTASRIYKLYSAQEMVVSSAGLTDGAALNLESDVPSTWDTLPGVYADLNEPAPDVAGNLMFPIVDPRAMDMATPSYPGSTTPEGFSYDSKLAVSKTTINGVRAPGGTASSQRLPMPVRWVYVLQDGSLGVMSQSASPKFVPFSGQKVASTSNPIVGRLAFWTDDESGKVNINTASEGMFWDTPRCVTSREIEFAKNPPVRNEVQRFGGHPATTCLSTIFYPGERLLPSNSASAAKLQNLYAVTPRVNANAGLLTSSTSPVDFDTDRLYASVDEFLLDDPSDTTSTAQSFSTRSVQGVLGGDADKLKKLRFLLTAESRSPETTAAGFPRVSIWPVSYRPEAANNKRTSFDNVSAFASTLGNHPFHFRRSSAASNMDDFSNYYNAESTDSFGYGMIHNNSLAQYLIELAKLPNQGYSKSFAQKYDDRTGSPTSSPYNVGSGIVSMLEYIRGTNANDSTHSTKSVTPRVPVDAYSQASANWIGTDTLGQVAAVDMTYYSPPLNTDNKILKRNANDDGNDRVWTTGIGREFTVSEFGLVFILAAENPASSTATKTNPDLVTLLNLQPGQKAIQVGIVAEGFCAGQGYTMIAPSTSFNVSSLENLRITTTGFGTRGPGGAVITPPLVQKDGDGDVSTGYRSLWGTLLHNVSHLQYLSKIKPVETPLTGRNTTGDWWAGWGGSGGYWMYADSNANGGSDAAAVADLDVASDSLTSSAMYSRGYFLVPSAATSMTVSSVRTTSLAERCLEIRVGNQRNGDYSSRRLLAEVPANMVVPVPTKPLELASTFSKRYKNAREYSGNRFAKPELIDASDVVRTWVVRHGDYRLAYQRLREGAGANGVDASKRLFVPHPAWDPVNIGSSQLAASQLKGQIHSFVKAGGKPHKTGKAGSLFLPGVEYSPTWGDGTTEANLVPDADYNNLTATTSDYRPDFPVNGNSTVFRANIPSNYPYTVKPWETRDWDNGTGIAPDGAYWNKPDDGARVYDGTIPPYFSQSPWDGVNINSRPANQTTAPNQLLPSPVMFGSLPSAPSTGIQWTTYLFRPDITPGGHLGAKDHSTKGAMAGAPPDHALLDWFWMPVVQPYPISEPFSTAGKVNLNYRIVPFTNIKRATGLHAVLKSEEMLAIPTSAGKTYKDYTKISLNSNWRHYIDADKTLLQWESLFDAGQYFMNAGDVCEQFLVPKDDGVNGSTGSAIRSAMSSYWGTRQLTGDNTMERPYANIYPRVTTRSNTYRVHFLVQTITKARSSEADTFDPDKDLVTGEKQGDALVERAIDPNDASLKKTEYDYIGKAVAGSLSTAKSLDSLYTWRIRHVRRFTR
ncbi:Verru_Chthon cassette protein A [Verrucomicrobium sp. BvORR106]|uniref:Verru_Chthon cassette protein A n=1 Tax=Verrucomicrobium sp. BvORR106 TaxID=1403819 RepID=UPI0005714894|nr:Verru_Chthon cassette protein A [Verrucomicrobium sp. BvORR106]